MRSDCAPRQGYRDWSSKLLRMSVAVTHTNARPGSARLSTAGPPARRRRRGGGRRRSPAGRGGRARTGGPTPAACRARLAGLRSSDAARAWSYGEMRPVACAEVSNYDGLRRGVFARRRAFHRAPRSRAARSRRRVRRACADDRTRGCSNPMPSTSSELRARTVRASDHGGEVEPRGALPRKCPIVTHHARTVLRRTVTEQQRLGAARERIAPWQRPLDGLRRGRRLADGLATLRPVPRHGHGVYQWGLLTGRNAKQCV
jgi:hypothetical protein